MTALSLAALARRLQSPTNRKKVFGPALESRLNDEQKRNLLAHARRLRTEASNTKSKSPLTRTAIDVLAALVWRFHNRLTGRCFPSYEAIAKAAGCARSSVHEAIASLEAAGLLSWVNRIARRIVDGWDELLGIHKKTNIPQRTSNSYMFTKVDRPPGRPKSESKPGTGPVESQRMTACPDPQPELPLSNALDRFWQNFTGRKRPL